MFDKNDHQLLASKGIDPEQVEKQITYFKVGMKPVKLDRPATPGDGIEQAGEAGMLMYAGIFDKNSSGYSKVKFIPASGAASRMFKDLFAALGELSAFEGRERDYVKNNSWLDSFFRQLPEYAFYSKLRDVAIENGLTLELLLKEESYKKILELILQPAGLDYGNKPKGVLKFHKYENFSLTPVEEHVSEAAGYLVNKDKTLRIHFTVSPEHSILFQDITTMLAPEYLKQGIQLEASFSTQESSTDTLAVDMNNEPFRENDGKLHFRPGGHGALLLNLERMEEDFIFISNIDNVGTKRDQYLRILTRKYLGGYLLEKISIINQLLIKLDNGFNMYVREDIIRFVENHISGKLAKEMKETDDGEFILLAFQTLNRPVRVCGMVKNTGEPGGGPFWVIDHQGNVSKQIIESSQIDMDNPQQKEIFNSSTHFNPVDIACCIKDYQGEKFSLPDFRDDDMAFIAKKSSGGRDLKALELPGLWNGSMAGWITFFLDVPQVTFSPVKTVFDLVRPEHIP